MWQDVASGNVQTATGSYASQLAFFSRLGQGDRRADARAHEEAADVPTFYEQGLTDKVSRCAVGFGCARPPHARGNRPKLSDLMVEGGKTERVLKIQRPVRHRRRRARRRLLQEGARRRGPVVLDIIRSLQIDPQ